MRTARLTAALAVCIGALAALAAPASAADWHSDEFGIANFSNTYEDPSGNPLLEAGSHADVTTALGLVPTTVEGRPAMAGQIRDVETDLPVGFYGNPQALPTCTMEQIALLGGVCSPAAQVGYLHIVQPPLPPLDFPIYNAEAPDEQTAVLFTMVLSVPTKIVVSARTDGDYGLTATFSKINQALTFRETVVHLWGVPADPVHDNYRFGPGGIGDKGHPAGIEPKPFLSLPVRCEPMTTTVRVASWQEPGVWHTASDTSPPLTDCAGLDFSPTLQARPTTNVADSPSGLEADLHLPQNVDDPDKRSSAMLREATVKLPEGLVINPAAANGLAACSPAQIGLTTAVGAGDPHFTKASPTCPDASRIGSVEVDTPAFADPLKGSVYTMTPHQNPFGTLLGIYVVLEGHGLVVKLAGKVVADPKTGRLTSTFADNPQLPFEDFKLKFDGGALGILRTPATCGKYATTSEMVPWSAPETPTVSPRDEYAITQGPGGKSCVSSEAAMSKDPAFEAGSSAPLAGKYRPFEVNLRRDDGSQQFSTVKLTPPPGLVAKLAGTAICPEAALGSAAAKDGKAEQASPSCPAASEVGSVYAAAGAGPAPYVAPGKVYIAGPYKGAPLSLAAIVPAVAGPFDLGTIVTRVAVQIDPRTAQITATSDPVPTILEGIPLDVRSVSVRLDRPNFSLNPTSCDPSEVAGSLLTLTGATAALRDRFQLGECGRLRFKPSLRLSLQGGHQRGDNPALTAVLKPRAGDANIASVAVALPHSEFLEQAHIRTICTRVQFAADACPKGSIYGKVKVFTPLLDYPLTGNVVLRSSDNELPDLVPDLRGPAFQPIRFEAAGRIDSVRGGIRNTFDLVPDVPFTKLVMHLGGGQKSLLANSRDICRTSNRANVRYTAHNGLVYSARPELRASCGKQGKGGGRRG